MSWINEVEMAKSMDDLLSSQSNEMLDARIASALRRIISNFFFGTRVSVEEQRAQIYFRFLRGRQIAYMIFAHFQSTGAYGTAQGLSDLFNICLQNHDVQDFLCNMRPDLFGNW